MRETNQVPRRPRRLGRGPAAVCAALLLAWSAGCDIKEALFFMPAPLLTDGGPTTGTVTGTVTSGTTPIPNATVTIGARTGTTNASGTYTITNVPAGAQTVTTTATGFTCPNATATVLAGQSTTTNVACTQTPAPPGSIDVGVTVNGSPRSGVAVTIRQGTTTVATGSTGTNGRFVAANLPPGAYDVSITPPAGVTCTSTSAAATVASNQTAVVNLPCTQSAGDFVVNLGTPPPGWNHPQGATESIECKVISTSPAQPGASYMVTTAGPGVLAQASPGFLDPSGRAEIRVRISSTGTYVNNVTVTSGAVQRSASISVSVTGAPNVCPSLTTSSARFKSDVAALLPGGASFLGLRPVAFRYLASHGDPGVPQVGLIAEEVVRVFPRAVARGPDGGPFGIYYGVLTGLVIAELETRAGASLKGGIARLAETLDP
ncbi:MAG: carboxypeptidase regulatory-like domain-containing protein [Gemmatimonadota bacterium]